MLKVWFKRKKQVDVEIKDKFSIKDIDNFIYDWNNNYPIDRWYRQKYNIAFGSPEHRVLSFIDMYIEWKEEQIFNEFLREGDKEEYTPGDWLSKKEVSADESASDKELMEAFMNPDAKINI